MVINAEKKLTIVEHTIKTIDCANNYKISRFKVINCCSNSFDLVRLKSILIYKNKQEDFEYKMLLFI